MEMTHPRKINWTEQMIVLLGTDHDGKVALKIRTELGIKISTSSVQVKRSRLGISPYPTDPLIRSWGYDPISPPETIGQTIRLKRIYKGLSQKALAKKIGCCSRTLWKIESDKVDLFKPEYQSLFQKIVQILDMNRGKKCGQIHR